MKPRKNSPHYVQADGAVWKFTSAQFDAFRVALTEGKGPYIGDFGRLIIVNLISLRDLEQECEVAEDDDNFGRALAKVMKQLETGI